MFVTVSAADGRPLRKMYYVSFYFQSARGGTPLRSGVEYIAVAIPQVVATAAACGLTTRTGHVGC